MILLDYVPLRIYSHYYVNACDSGGGGACSESTGTMFMMLDYVFWVYLPVPYVVVPARIVAPEGITPV
jgi:hypothetical protein